MNDSLARSQLRRKFIDKYGGESFAENEFLLVDLLSEQQAQRSSRALPTPLLPLSAAATAAVAAAERGDGDRVVGGPVVNETDCESDDAAAAAAAPFDSGRHYGLSLARFKKTLLQRARIVQEILQSERATVHSYSCFVK